MRLETLEEVFDSERANYSECQDDSVPEGHFLVCGIVVGTYREYLLRGSMTDPDSPVIGQLVCGTAYAGSSAVGGTYLGTPKTSEEAWDRIIKFYDWSRE